MDSLTFGVFLPFYALSAKVTSIYRYQALKDVVLECERLGYDVVWFDDHLMYGNVPVFETWTVLAAVAAVTTRVRLGTMVTNAVFRNPAYLAKAAATFDVLSNGRLEFGVGSGIQREEHLAYGYDFPRASARVAAMKEAIEIIKKLWMQPKATYQGTYYRIEDAVCEPKPLQKPHPPMTIGGAGEEYTLRVTAQHADRADFGYLSSVELYKRKLQILKMHCSSFSRDFSTIRKTAWLAGQIITANTSQAVEEKVRCLMPAGTTAEEFSEHSFIGTPDKLNPRIKQYTELGATHFMLYFPELPDTTGLQSFAETYIKK